MENIIEKYIKYVENFLLNYYRLLLNTSYERKMVDPFINKYIDVRYYNNSIYEKEQNFIERINKELKLVAKELIVQNQEKTEKIKNIFALFGYILYIDDCLPYTNLKTLLKTLFEDENIKLTYDLETKEKFTELVKNFINQKKEFLKLFNSKEFNLKFKRLKRNLFLTELEQNCNINPLYSEYAINKAFKTGIVLENKFYLTCLLLSGEVLKNTINLDYNKNYVVDFPITLFTKSKKINRYLKVLENNMVLNKINLRFYYKDYLKNKESINKIINMGYSVSIVLDETFIDDYDSLILFSYVFIYEKYDYYDIIIDSKDTINTTIVTL